MYKYQSALKYLVNKSMLGGKICRWLFLFQEYHFEVIVKLDRLNVGPNNLSKIKTSEETTSLEEVLTDAQLFVIHVADITFLTQSNF